MASPDSSGGMVASFKSLLRDLPLMNNILADSGTEDHDSARAHKLAAFDEEDSIRSSIRGSASSYKGIEHYKGELAVASQHLDQAAHGVNDLQSFLSIEDPRLVTILEEQGVPNALEVAQHFRADVDLLHNIQTSIKVLQPMLKDTIAIAVDVANMHDLDLQKRIDSAERQLSGLADANDSTNEIFQDEDGAFSSNTKTGKKFDHFALPDFQAFMKDPSLLKAQMKKVLSMKGGRNIACMFGLGRHQHHRRSVQYGGRSNHHSNQRRRRAEGIGQVATNTCEAQCNEGTDEERKSCNCADLFYCANKFKATHYAALFSRGLVDGDTGTIKVETVDLTSSFGDERDEGYGEIKRENNTALDNINDAKLLLRKMNKIRGLVLLGEAGQDTCDELLDEFHVPCDQDQGVGCSGDGRSYRLVS